MATIKRVELLMVDLKPKVARSDAIQSFVSQETPMVRITDSDGQVGIGYTYTIGTGGSSVMALLNDHLAPLLLGEEAEAIEGLWHKLEFATHATTIGAITALALAAVDTALWDLRCKRAGLPLYVMAGGAKDRVPLYTTEGGWLHLETGHIVQDAITAKEKGFIGSKVKIGKPSVKEDYRRLEAVLDAVEKVDGRDGYQLLTDCNQAFNVDEGIRRAAVLEPLGLGWIEEPYAADDIDGHVRLCRSTSTPIAVGESLYSIRHFREYMQRGAASIIQVDVARIGGITPWLKVAHMAEAFNMAVCPHFLMELHIALVCAVPNGRWVEYIPQLDDLTNTQMRIEDGYGVASQEPGLGIDWDWSAIEGMRIKRFDATLEA